jgi:low affinity Fe/Cu permease
MQKQAGIGMIICVIGSVLVLAGGILQNRKKQVLFDVDGKLEHLIDIDAHARRDGVGLGVQDVKEIIEQVQVNIESKN